ncbi:Protein of unknown function [Bacillus cereus]|nr:Protein of unknown function [Bacillus cereus]
MNIEGIKTVSLVVGRFFDGIQVVK